MIKKIIYNSLLFSIILVSQTLSADSFLSSSPITNVAVIGQANLDKIEALSYNNRNTWATKLLNNCNIANNLINDLTSNGNISTIAGNVTSLTVAAGGFSGINEITQQPQATVDPSYVFKFNNSASEADIAVLDNAVGYVLLQGGNVRFNLDDAGAFDFPLEYAQVQFNGSVSGNTASAFWAHVGTVDSALYTGLFAGFTQLGNRMLFLKPSVGVGRFYNGISAAASSWAGSPSATFITPKKVSAGVAFSGNDWATDPAGTGYLSQLGSISPSLQCQLDTLKAQSLQAANDLINAINTNHVNSYLNSFNSCPSVPTPASCL